MIVTKSLLFVISTAHTIWLIRISRSIIPYWNIKTDQSELAEVYHTEKYKQMIFQHIETHFNDENNFDNYDTVMVMTFWYTKLDSKYGVWI